MKPEDILSFLDKFRKTEEKDPLHKWIGTYNLKREILRQFFTWLNDPDTDRNHRSRPKIMENIPQFKRKEVSIYKPSDLWTQERTETRQGYYSGMVVPGFFLIILFMRLSIKPSDTPRTSILFRLFRLWADFFVASVICCIDCWEDSVVLDATPAVTLREAYPQVSVPVVSTCQLGSSSHLKRNFQGLL